MANEDAKAALAQQKADIAANLAQQKAAIADASAAAKAAIADEAAAKKAAIASEAAQEKANIAATAAAEKAASASSLADKKAASAAALADQKAAIASRLQQEKSVQQAILSAQKNAAQSSMAFDKQAHALKMANIKAESAAAVAWAKETARAQENAAKRADAAQKAAAKAAAGSGGGGDKGALSSFIGGLFPGAAQLGTSAGLASAAGGVVAAGAAKLLEAAVELGKAAYATLEAGEKLAIEQTSKKEVQSAAFGKLGGNYEQVVKVALDLGIDEGDAVAQAKKLLNAKFSKEDIPVLLKIKAGMDLAGLDGDALLKKLETIKLEPKVKAKDVEGLAKLGVDSKKVYEELAKTLHTNVAGAMAKVKSGAADSKDVIAAIEKVAGKSFGPLAETLGNSVPALLAKVKGEFFKLFDSVDLGPIKEFLKNVSKVLEGPGGKALKESITELFGALNEALFDQFKGAEGAKKLEAFAQQAAKAIHELAQAAKDLKPLAEMLFYAAMGAAELAEDLAKIAKYRDLWAGGGKTGGGIGSKDMWNIGDASKGLGDAADFGGMADSMTVGGMGAGMGLTDGFVQGLEAGEPDAIAAAVQVAMKALRAAKDALGVHSPSTEFAEVGHYSTEGMAKGFAANDNANTAAAGMARGALDSARAASGGGAGGAGAGASGGGGGITINIVMGPGATAADAAKVKAEIDKGLPGWLAMSRRAGRDGREGRAA